jgi:hypothetical protein
LFGIGLGRDGIRVTVMVVIGIGLELGIGITFNDLFIKREEKLEEKLSLSPSVSFFDEVDPNHPNNPLDEPLIIGLNLSLKEFEFEFGFGFGLGIGFGLGFGTKTALTVTEPPRGVNFKALETRLRST